MSDPHTVGSTANPRFLASFRIAVGVIAAAKGGALLFLDAHPLTVAAWVALSCAVIIGWKARWAAVALLPLWVLLLGEGLYKNHLYLLVLTLLLVALSECERHYAVRRREPGQVSGWPVFLMRAQLSVVYVFAGIAKMNADFLSGDTLVHYFDRSVFPLPDLSSVAAPLAFSTVAIELLVGLAVWSRPLRPLAFGVALPLHLGMLLVAYQASEVVGVVVFAALMFTLLSAFLDLPERGRLVVWDDSCSFCCRWVAAFRRLDVFGALRFTGGSSPAAYDGTGVTPSAAAEAMQLVEPDGTVRTGFNAVRGIVAVLPGGLLIAPWMALPGVRHIGHAVYRRVAARRTCAYQPVAAEN